MSRMIYTNLYIRKYMDWKYMNKLHSNNLEFVSKFGIKPWVDSILWIQNHGVVSNFNNVMPIVIFLKMFVTLHSLVEILLFATIPYANVWLNVAFDYVWLPMQLFFTFGWILVCLSINCDYNLFQHFNNLVFHDVFVYFTTSYIQLVTHAIKIITL